MKSSFIPVAAALLVLAVLLSGCTQPYGSQQGAGGLQAGDAGTGAGSGTSTGTAGAGTGSAGTDGATAGGTATQGAVKEFEMTAKRFEFTPSTITVNKGDTVKIRITSLDVTHGFTIDEFNVKETIAPGQEVIVEFIAGKEGNFKFYCWIYCGEGHSGMNGTLIVN